MERTLLYEHGRNGTFSFIQLGLDHKTSCRTVRVRLEFHHLCCEKDHLKEFRDSLFCVCGYRYEHRASAPVLRDQFIFCELLLYSLHIGARLVDLVDRNDDLHSGSLGMVDRLHCLRHHAVVRGDDKDRNICCVCTAHTHGSERLMSRCIQERDLLAVDFNNVSSDVLGDSACLAVCHIGMTDRVQKRSLTMIDMAHDADYRRTLHHKALVLLVLFQEFFDHIDNFLLLAEHVEFHRDLLGCVKVDLLVHCHDFALHEELLDDHGRHDLHLVCQLFDREDFRDHDLLDLLFLLLRRLLLRFLRLSDRFLLLVLLCFSFESLVSVFFLLVVSLFVLRLVSLALLLLHHRSAQALSVITAGIRSSVPALSALTRSLSAEPLVSSASLLASSAVAAVSSVASVTIVSSSLTLRVSVLARSSSFTFSGRTLSPALLTSSSLSSSLCAGRSCFFCRTLSLSSSLLTGCFRLPGCRTCSCLSRSLRTGRSSFSCRTGRTVLARCSSGPLCGTGRALSLSLPSALDTAAVLRILRTHYEREILLFRSGAFLLRSLLLFLLRTLSSGCFLSDLGSHVILQSALALCLNIL